MSGCPSCGGPLEDGFIEDGGESNKGYLRWIPGPLEKGLFGGARRFGKTRVDIDAYRCQSCGLLSLYVEGSPELTARQAHSRVDDGPVPPAPSPFGPGPQA